jgi:Tetracyclin repressor-like, C-terminal domain
VTTASTPPSSRTSSAARPSCSPQPPSGRSTRTPSCRACARGPDHVGEALSELFLRVWDDQGQRNPLLTLLRAATTEPRAARLLDEFLRTRLLGPLLARLGSDQPELRRDLVISQLAGLALTRYILRFEPIASTPAEQLIPLIAPTLQRYLAGTL